jgi:hypothetical protein
MNSILKEAWNTAQNTEDKREKIQALSLAKECYSMKMDLLTNATVVDDAIRFVSNRSNEKTKPSSNSNEGNEEPNEPDYDEEIEKAKQSPSFEREYNLKYLGKIGNVFHTKDIEAAIEKGRKYNPDNFNPYYSLTSRSMGIDPAYGSSAFGIVVTEWVDG